MAISTMMGWMVLSASVMNASGDVSYSVQGVQETSLHRGCIVEKEEHEVKLLPGSYLVCASTRTGAKNACGGAETSRVCRTVEVEGGKKTPVKLRAIQ